MIKLDSRWSRLIKRSVQGFVQNNDITGATGSCDDILAWGGCVADIRSPLLVTNKHNHAVA